MEKWLYFKEYVLQFIFHWCFKTFFSRFCLQAFINRLFLSFTCDIVIVTLQRCIIYDGEGNELYNRTSKSRRRLGTLNLAEITERDRNFYVAVRLWELQCRIIWFIHVKVWFLCFFAFILKLELYI